MAAPHPSSPNLISFDDPPAASDPFAAFPSSAGASSAASHDLLGFGDVSALDSLAAVSLSDDSAATTAPSSAQSVANEGEEDDSEDDDERYASLHFFVSCTGVDGNLVATATRSAQTFVRGALSMLTQTSNAPKPKPATDVAVQVVVSREIPLQAPGAAPSTAPTDDIWGSAFHKSASLDSLTASDGETSPKAATRLSPMGTLDAESYWSERRRSRNPNFSVGFNLRCQVAKRFDRHVQILIMIPDDNSHSYKNGQRFGYAQTSFQELYTIATSGDYRQKMTLPVHSGVFEGATVVLRFADIRPQPHPLFNAHRSIFRSYLFYPLMREDQEQIQVSEAKLAIEEAAEVDYSVKIPLQLMRVCLEELTQMYDDWKQRYNYVRKVNRHFDDDAEALVFGYDVVHVQAICGRNLSAGATDSSGGYENALTTGASRPSAFSMGMVTGQTVFINRLKSQAGKWGAGGSSSGSFSVNGSAEGAPPRGDMAGVVNPFVVVKYGDATHGPQEQVVGKTNTEYDSPDPVWSSNKFALTKCQHGKPSTKYFTSSQLPSRLVVSPVNALKEFAFYRQSTRTAQTNSELIGWLRFEVFNETYSYMTGVENEVVGEVMIPLQSVRDAMTVEDKVVDYHDEHGTVSRQVVSSLTLVDWFDVRSPTTDECFGQIQLRINIQLANPVDENSTGIDALDPTLYRRAADCAPPPCASPLDTEMSLNFLYAHVMALQNHIAEVTDSIRLCEHLIEQKKTFKSSQHKKRADIQSIPTNLHVSYFRIIRNIGSQWRQMGYEAPTAMLSAPPAFTQQASTEDLLGLGFSNSNAPPPAASTLQSITESSANSLGSGHCNFIPETHATVTCGAPTAHAMGLSDSGLREMETEIHRLQSTMDKCTPRMSGASPTRASASNTNGLVVEDDAHFFSLIDDSDVDDSCSNDSAMSSDVSAPVEPLSPTSDKEGNEAARPKRNVKKYSMMAVRVAAGARVKATSKKRFATKKSSRHLDHRDSDDHSKKASAGASSPRAVKYPVLRTDPEDTVDPYMSTAFAARVLCQLERLRAEYYFRKSVAVSQAVSSLVTSFVAELDLCLQEQNVNVLQQFARIGFLIGWESLISSHGKELCMISDAWVAIKCLETFAFQLYESSGREVRLERRDGVGYTIKVPVPSSLFTTVLPEELREGGLINVTSVLFTQGINEMQSLANMVRHSGVSIQSKINSTSLRSIVEYYKCFSDICGVGSSEASVGAHPDEILRNLRMSVESESSSSKNTCILLHAADAVRSLHGGRVTYCKSGKDRTAMSVTLEQARLLVQRKRQVLQEIESGSASEYGPLDEVKSVANTMRQFGARIEIARKNVGRYKYSFNSIQRKLLPDIYRPPVATIQDMVTSVTARDS